MANNIAQMSKHGELCTIRRNGTVRLVVIATLDCVIRCYNIRCKYIKESMLSVFHLFPIKTLEMKNVSWNIIANIFIVSLRTR